MFDICAITEDYGDLYSLPAEHPGNIEILSYLTPQKKLLVILPKETDSSFSIIADLFTGLFILNKKSKRNIPAH